MKVLIFLILISKNFKIIKNNENEIKILFKPEIEITQSKEFVYLSGERKEEIPAGYPDIPSFLLNIEISPYYEYKVEVKVIRETFIKNKKLKKIPSYKDDGLTPFFPAVSYNLPYPEKIYKKKKLSFIRAKPILPIIIYGAQETSEGVRILKELEIILKKTKKRNIKVKRIVEREELKNLYKKLILNPGNKSYILQQEYEDLFSKAPFWLKLLIPKRGIYFITYQDIKKYLNFSPENLNPDKICIYTRISPLPEHPDSYNVLPQKVPFYFKDKNIKGVFEPSDTIFFFAFSPEGVRPEKGKIIFPFHPYSSYSVYFISFEGEEGLKIDSLEGSPRELYPYIKKAIKTAKHEKNLENLAKSGLRWIGEFISDTFMHKLSLLKFSNPSKDTASFIFRFVRGPISGNPGNLILNIFLNKKLIQQREYPEATRPLDSHITFKAPFTNNPSIFIKRTQKYNQGDFPIYIDYFIIKYKAFLKDIKDSIGFFSSDLEANFVLKGKELKKGLILKIHSPFNYAIVKNYYHSSDSIVFSSESNGDTVLYIYSYRFLKPHIEKFENPGLKKLKGADYIIIGPKEFKNLFNYYIRWKKTNLYIDTVKIQNPTIEYIEIEKIFEEFGFGIRDPVAIRNFLKYSFYYFEIKPLYVLLAGKGTYDFRNFEKTGVKNYVPPYEWGYGVDINNPSFTYDDFFVEFEPGNFDPDMIIGRIPAEEPSELSGFLIKAINYEKGIYKGLWRNKIVGVADDKYLGPSKYDGINHSNQVTRVLRGLPNSLEKIPFYLNDYPFVEGKKRNATKSLIKIIKDGISAIFFFIHGNPTVVAHEELLKYPEDIPLLDAGVQLPFIFLGSCKTANFDRPEGAIGEKWMMKSGIGCLSSAALTFPGQNEFIIDKFFDQFKDFKFHTFGEACYIARFGSKKYIYLGDPTTLYRFPEKSGEFTYLSDTLKYRVKDSIKINFNSSAPYSILDIKNSSIIDTVIDTTEIGGNIYITRFIYFRKGKNLFKGYGPLIKNNYKFKILLPLPEDSFDLVRISAYNISGIFGKVVFVDSLPAKVIEVVKEDFTPPEIVVTYNGKELKDKDTLPPSFEIIIGIKDKSGIDLSKEEGLQIAIDFEPPLSLTDVFYYKNGDYEEGEAKYFFHNLSEGNHKIFISAIDIFGNRTFLQREIFIKEKTDTLVIKNIIGYPNPANKVYFIGFENSQPVTARLSVYTIRGIPVFQSAKRMFNPGFNSIKWNLKSGGGRKVANGLYFYILEIKDPFSDKIYTYRGKIIVYR